MVHIIDELRMGGAQVYLYRLLREFCQRPGYRHRVICLFGSGEFSQKIRELEVDVAELYLGEAIRQKHYWKAIEALKTAIDRDPVDVIHSHLTWSRILSVMAASPKRGRKHIASEHGDIYFNSVKWKAVNFGLQFRIDRILPVSQAMAQWLQKYYRVRSDRMRVLHNSIDTENFQISENPVTRAELGIDEDAFLFCTIGMLGVGVDKRIDVAIRAVSEARSKSGKNIQLVICGDGPLRFQLESLAREQAIGTRVHFLGKRNDVPDILHLSDAFCHSAPFEPFGLVALEAMWLKKVAIVPKAGGIQEVVQHGKTGYLYEALNHRQLADQMIQVCNQPEAQSAIVEAAYKQVKDHYQMDHYVDQLIEHYQLHT